MRGEKSVAKNTDGGVLLFVKVQTGVSKSFVEGIWEDRLKVKVCSRPLKGAANKECISLLSKKLKIAKSKINIVNGERSKEKTFFLFGLSVEEIITLLGS